MRASTAGGHSVPQFLARLGSLRRAGWREGTGRLGGWASVALCQQPSPELGRPSELLCQAQLPDGPRKRAGSKGAQTAGGWPSLHWGCLSSGTRDGLLQGAHSLTGEVQLRLLTVMAEKVFLLTKISSLWCGSDPVLGAGDTRQTRMRPHGL